MRAAPPVAGLAAASSPEPADRSGPGPRCGGVRLLDVDPELGSGLEGDQLAEARDHAVVAAVMLPPGAWALDQLAAARGVRGEVHGFLVVDGVVIARAALVRRVSGRLIFAGAVVLVDAGEEASISVQWGWSAVTRTRLAVLDDRLLMIGARWPRLLAALLRRAAHQNLQALLHQAISQLPRVEDRLLALMWSIADRRGIVRGDGVYVPLPVTHQALAQMIGAQRPTVTLGLARLAEEDLLRPEKGGWVIDPRSAAQFQRAEDAPDVDERPAAGASA